MTILRSTDPATGEAVWEGPEADAAACAAAVARARAAFPGWAAQDLDARIALARRYAERLTARRAELAELIARETGKTRWESDAEAGSMIGKVEVSIAANAERTGTRSSDTGFGKAILRHRPHGVMAVLGPYNFPGHLPNGHIVPALLAGNTVVFKPSELTPAVGALMADAWREAGLPDGVLELVQGGRDSGAALIAQDIDGLLFTGSATAGAHFRRIFADRPQVILALELGGNNPLIAWDGDPDAVASIVVQSAYITTGQRCSCARRLIVPQGAAGDAIVEAVAALAAQLRIGAWNDAETAFMGPLISAAAADTAEARVAQSIAAGARPVLTLRRLDRSPAFVTPALLDVTGIATADEELFAPVLTVRRVADFDTAIAEANATRFGLSAGLVSDDEALWQRLLAHSRAGIVNRNRPTTGAAAAMPFGGIGESGNHRPSAWYAADYCAYPVASFEAAQVRDDRAAIPGLR
ncbi:succinylglutamate-semialdehyde dehydrogenase [Sphingomonas canadensis]|uniref:Succinylglutamate-semialdehyde dehydrogenase n=1 Tax=Sphingomonas canadensis TaxID=1219257 RepID=A0ABW3H9V5_9SPHN|nr:succinylglutamate-semialdehyde dehydrogenase [Sphingomonas canadensis]MCW3837654.1 succinylglutamate-semialdehyde dehydrogenase [Sphingomonas canadensis]